MRDAIAVSLVGPGVFLCWVSIRQIERITLSAGWTKVPILRQPPGPVS